MSVTLAKPVSAVSETELEDREKLAESDPRSSVIWINPACVSGTACFAGTRVPLQILWDHLEESLSMDDFLDGFPGVTHEQATVVLQMALAKLLESLPENTPWR